MLEEGRVADPTALAQRAFEPISEDETLRGSLTDDGFNPLVEWASQALLSAAEDAAKLPDPDASDRMDSAGEAVKRVMAAVVQAAASRDRGDLLALLQAPLIARRLPTRARLAVAEMRLGDDADENAKALTAALSGLHP